MACSTGFTRSWVARCPLLSSTASPASSWTGAPLIGQSSVLHPLSAILSASERFTVSGMVLISTQIPLRRVVLARPTSPVTAETSASADGSSVNTTGQLSAACAGLEQPRPPAARNGAGGSRRRHPVTRNAAASRRSAIGKPIWPRPTTATAPGQSLACLCTGAKSVIIVSLSAISYIRERIYVSCRCAATLTAGDHCAFPAQNYLLKGACIGWVLWRVHSLKSPAALVRPILSRSASEIAAPSNQSAAWSMFSNGQSVENRIRSEPTSRIASISDWVRKLPDVVM